MRNMTDIHQSPLWAEFMEKIGWKIDPISDHHVYSKVILGKKISKVPRFSEKLDLKLIEKVPSIMLVKIEPDFSVSEKKLPEIEKLGYRPDNWSLAPTRTFVIDLKPDTDTLLKNMEKDTRYSVRRSEREGVEVRQTDSFDDFLKMYQETGKRNHFWLGSQSEMRLRYEIFKKKGEVSIFTAFLKKTPLASSVVYYWGQKAHYLHAASSSEHRELMANYLMVWSVMQDAKKRGFRYLDLEGGVDPRMPSTKDWHGFSHFKKGFGGVEIGNLGSFSKARNPVLNFLWKHGKNL
jgi:peptidoglycan pentaglycine glycine transferase (the first glycine)